MEKERFDEWFEAHFAGWLRAMRCGFRHNEVTHFRASLLTAWNAALSAARERIREMEAGHANFRTMADAMMRKKDSELIAIDSVVVHAKDFQTRQRGLMQTQDSYGLFQADNRLETALKRLDALRATKGAG